MERRPEILIIGTGITIPPNAYRVVASFGLFDRPEIGGVNEKREFVAGSYYLIATTRGTAIVWLLPYLYLPIAPSTAGP